MSWPKFLKKIVVGFASGATAAAGAAVSSGGSPYGSLSDGIEVFLSGLIVAGLTGAANYAKHRGK